MIQPVYIPNQEVRGIIIFVLRITKFYSGAWNQIYNKIDSEKDLVVKKDAIANLPELEWVYFEHTKQHLLYSAAKNQLYTKDLTIVKGRLWKDKESDIMYQIYSSPKVIFANRKRWAQKIENAHLSKVSSENV